MSRIGKQPIKIPDGTEVSINDNILVKGPKGELSRQKPDGFLFELQDGILNIVPEESTVKSKTGPALWGLYRSLVANMIEGVSVGFKKVLELQGVGYRATVKDNNLEMQLGFSHPVIIKVPDGINFQVEKNKITVSGYDKQLVGQIAAEIRKKRPPEPYKGKGIRYENEVVIRKAGKKAVATQ